MLADIIADAFDLLVDSIGVELTYRRGASNVELRGVPGRALFQGDEAERMQATWSASDWLVAPSALVLDEDETLPQPGDTVERTDSGQLITYEVLPNPEGHCYRLDPSRRLLRIHTKEIDQAPE